MIAVCVHTHTPLQAGGYLQVRVKGIWLCFRLAVLMCFERESLSKGIVFVSIILREIPKNVSFFRFFLTTAFSTQVTRKVSAHIVLNAVPPRRDLTGQAQQAVEIYDVPCAPCEIGQRTCKCAHLHVCIAAPYTYAIPVDLSDMFCYSLLTLIQFLLTAQTFFS